MIHDIRDSRLRGMHMHPKLIFPRFRSREYSPPIEVLSNPLHQWSGAYAWLHII